MVSENDAGNKHSPSESTPLLQDDNAVEDNGVVERERTQSSTRDRDDADEPLVEEPTVGKLLIQLGSVWVGVFFAALGEFFDPQLRKSIEV